MAAGVQQNGSGNPCAGQTPIWGVCYDSVNPPTDQGQAYGISTSNSGQLGTIYSLQSLQSNACAETNCSNSCSPNYCRRNSTSGGNSSEINEFDDIVVVEQNESQTAKNFCCAPYTQFTIETQTTSVIGPTSGVYNSNNFESPTGYQLPGNYSNNIYRYSDGGECNYGKNIVKCTEKVIIIVGCTDPNASNYNAEANQAGKCEYPTIGCKDVDAINYDANASENCENFECCKYEDEIRDPIDCGNTLKQSKLEVEINTINSKLQSLKNQRIEIIDEQNNGFIPVTNSGYDSYIPYTNINADITDANTNEIFETSTNEGVYRKYIATNITGDIGTDFNSINGNPDLSDSSRWIPIIDGNGVVSFVLNDVDNDNNDTLTLSHNTQENAGADLYKQFCTSKGYVFNRFTLENGRQIPVTTNPNDTYIETHKTTQKCVDSKYITCDEVADVKMVFASNEWSGFYLPEDDGDTDVEISMDVMVKFNADTLLKECIKGDCGIPFIDINSTYDTACKNYVVFVNNDQDKKDIKTSKHKSLITDSETGQGKWIYESEDIQTWQRNGLQNEPNVECCETGMLGEIVNSKEYLNNGKTLNFDNLNIPENSQLNSDRKDYLNIEKKYKSIISAVNDCDNVEYAEYVYRGCESNYSELITTETICSITPPDDCLGYTTLLQDYEVMINQLVLVDDSLTICINEYKFLQNEIREIDEEIKEKSSEKNKKGKELSEIQSSHKDQITKCENSLGKLRSQKKENQALLSNENSKDNPNYLIIISLQTKINEIEREIEDKELECYQTNRNHNITIENINADIDELKKCIDDLEYYKKQLRESIESKQCCLALGKEINEFKDTVKKNEYSAVLERSLSCYKKWENDLDKSYDRYNEEISDSGNVLNFMEDIIIDVSLEVDNSIGTIQNNRVTKYTTLHSYTTDINPVWVFDPTGGYTGVLLEGSESSINIVKDSVNVDLIAGGTTEGATRIFEPQWQKIKFTLDEGQCDYLRSVYPNKQFFIGLSIKNEKNCETTLLVDNIQINTDVNEIKRIYSANNCPSFDLSCVIDDRKSWVFSDGGVTTKYSVSNNYSEALSTDKKTLTFPKPQERYSGNLEYRYTDYSVNHSKLVLNSKETSFRIDPANAIECDVYNFWQEIDCDECNTLFSCTTATTLTYTNPAGGTLPLSGASCSSFDCDDVEFDIEVLYGKEWLRKLDIELNDYTLAKSMSFSVMNNTKDKDKGSQKVSNESYVNDLFKIQNINNYDVSYFLPESLGVGFDIRKSDCNSDIIEIKKRSGDVYTLISEETDGTLGFYSYTADTNDICELTSFVDEQCCNNVSGYLDYTFKINKPNYGWVDGACRWKKDDAIENNCDSDCSYYGTQLEETKFIYSGSSGVTLSSTCVDTPVCIKPLDYLDKQPNEVNIKPNFDTMVLSNLIDVKSRQVISDYPMLRLFYNQYLNANGCGASITNRLDYNTTFEVMDLIGDYWTDIIEQVVPATTIWDGHNNSGKVYRNTLFDQNKFPYKRYVLNYYDGECEINEITRDAIAINTGSTINLTESCLRGECFGSDLKECTEEQKEIQKALQEQIKALEDAIGRLENSDAENKETILELQRDLLKEFESDLAKQKEECESIEETASENQSASSELNNCDDIAKQLNEEEEKLKNIIPVGTQSYLQKKAFVDTLRIRYESCKRKSNINITQYTTMFITQIYDSNEYEGDVNVFGDPDWDSDVELLHACGSMEYKCPEKPLTEMRTIFKWGRDDEYRVIVDENGNDISNEQCCSKLRSADFITDDNGDKYCVYRP